MDKTLIVVNDVAVTVTIPLPPPGYKVETEPRQARQHELCWHNNKWSKTGIQLTKFKYIVAKPQHYMAGQRVRCRCSVPTDKKLSDMPDKAYIEDQNKTKEQNNGQNRDRNG